MKAERVPRWRVSRMNAAQLDAYDRLRWYSPGPAERARLKATLGWKRTRQETIALALELRVEGRGDLAIADELGIGDRYLTRLLEQVRDHEKTRRNPSIHTAEMAPTCESEGSVSPGRPGRQMYGGDAATYDFQTALRGAE
jgi:hypothetical protein